MTSTEILLTILFSPLSLLMARVIRPREHTRASPWVRAIGGFGLLATFLGFWIFLEESRTVLLLLASLIVPFLLLPDNDWGRTLHHVGLAEAFPLAFLALLLWFLSSLFSSQLTRTSISPDGRWELRCYDEYGSTLSIAPRGLASLDPRAYPSRRLVSFGSSPAPERIEWTGPREITTTRERPGETTRVRDDLGFRVLTQTRGEGITPADTPSRAASRRPR